MTLELVIIVFQCPKVKFGQVMMRQVLSPDVSYIIPQFRVKDHKIAGKARLL